MRSLIFTSHDLSTMNSEVFRRDEIWFVAKGNKENSKLYSLVEFKNDKGESVRKDAKFDKQYLEGKYGADPYLRKIIDYAALDWPGWRRGRKNAARNIWKRKDISRKIQFTGIWVLIEIEPCQAETMRVISMAERYVKRTKFRGDRSGAYMTKTVFRRNILKVSNSGRGS